MAIDLRIKTVKSFEDVQQNIKDIAEVVMQKQAVDITTTSIETTFADPEADALRVIVLELINNLKSA